MRFRISLVPTARTVLDELQRSDPTRYRKQAQRWHDTSGGYPLRGAYVDSEETAQEDGSAENLLDGDSETIWHTVWSLDHRPLPHRVVIDLGGDVTAAGVRLTPRQGDRPGKVKAFKVYFLQSAAT